MEIQVLGPLQVLCRDEADLLAGGKQRTLLAALAAHADHVVSTDRLVDILWGEDPPPTARRSLQAYVSRLRRQLGEAVVSRPPGYVLETTHIELDAIRFARLVEKARHLAPDEAMVVLDEALSLWRGPAYAGLADEDFARPEAVRLEELRLEAVELRADALLELARHAEVVAGQEALVEEHPFRERLWMQLVTALHRSGRQADSLRAADRHRQLLADAGLEPSGDFQRLEDAVFQRDLSLQAVPAPVGDLPERRSAFYGREGEIDAVADSLPRNRLVTLVGPGGVGKTRLALEVAHGIRAELAGGAWLCDVSGVTDPGSLPDVVADRLGLRARPATTEFLVEALRTRETLLVLDNCEHLLDAVAELVNTLLDGCRRLLVLATSRERLAVPGEVVWEVMPLDEEACVDLFSDRARAVRPGFRLGGDRSAVVEICRALDRLPLAVELAAARMVASTPKDLLRQIGHRFQILTGGARTGGGRQRTLRAMVDWSYELLTPRAQDLFVRLSVFSGGFTVDAARRIWDDDAGVPPILGRLVEQSMVVLSGDSDPPRYRMLETLRAYGSERLQEREDWEETLRRHARLFVEMAEEAERALKGASESAWVERLLAENDNLRTAHEWSVRHEPDLALRLSAALHFFALFRMRHEVLSWAGRALEAVPDHHPLVPAVAGSAANVLVNEGRFEETRQMAEFALHKGGDDDPRCIPALQALSDMAHYRGDLAESVRLATQAARLADLGGDPYQRAYALLSLALAAAYRGDRPTAEEFADQIRDIARATDNPTAIAWSRYVDGEILPEHDRERAARLLEESIDLARSVQNRFVTGVALVSLVSVRGRHGDPARALRSFEEVIRHWRRVGDWTHQWTTLSNLVDLLVRVGRWEPAAVVYGAVDRANPPSYGPEMARFAQAAEAMERAMGEEAFARTVWHGRRLDADQVVDLAIQAIEST